MKSRNESCVLCEICFDKTTSKSVTDHGCLIVTCKNCDISVHKRCCGINDSTFLCDKCANASHKPCLICEHVDGYLKKLSHEIWLHPICAFLTDDIEILDFFTMQMTLPHSLTLQGTVPQCEYCGVTTGQRLQCNHPGCLKATHAYCAYHAKRTNQPNCWQIDINLDNEAKENPYPEFKKYMENKEQELVHKKAEETKVTRSSRRLVGSDTTEGKQQNFILSNRGRQINIYCQSHRLPKIYCICEGNKTRASKDNNWVVACDYCDNWYHGECIGISKAESEIIKVYICDKCKAWENAKNLHLLKELEEKYKEECLVKDSDWSNALVPAKTNKLVDILLVAQIFVMRGAALIKYRCNIEILYNHLLNGAKIPLYLGSIIIELKKKMEVSVQLDNEVSQLIKITPILPIIDSSFNLLTENYTNNEKTKELINTYIPKYINDAKINTRLFEQIKRNQSLLESLHEIAEKFLSCMEIDEAIVHLQRLEESGLKFEAEISFLKDTISEFKEWEMNLGSLERVQVTEEVIYPEDGISQLNAKLESIEHILKGKINVDNVEQLLHEESLRFIKKQAISDLLTNEKKELEEMESTYKTYTNSGCTLEQFKTLIKEMCEGLLFSEDYIEILKEYGIYLRLYFIATEILKNGVLIDESTGDIIKTKCTFEDLKDIINKCENNKVKPLNILEALGIRVREVEKWRENYKSLVNHGESTETLHACIIKGEDYKLWLPEFENIQSQVEVLKVIEQFKVSQELISLPQLSQLVDKAKYSNVPSNVVEPLQALLESSQALFTESLRLIKLSVESYKDIESVINCLETIKKGRVQFSNIESLEKIVEEYKWQAEIASLANVASTANIEFKDLESLSKEVLEEEYKKGERVAENAIGPAGKLREMIPEVIWLKHAKEKFDSMNKLTKEELSELVGEMNKIRLDPSHTICGSLAKLVQNLNEKYTKVMNDYEYLSKFNIETIDEKEIGQVLQKTHSLKKDAFMSQVDLSELIGKIHKVEQYVNSYQLLVSLMRSEDKIDFPAFTKAVENFSSLQEGHGDSRLLEKSKDQMERYEFWTRKVNTYKTNKEASVKGNKQKQNIELLKEILKDAEQIELPLGDDIQALRNDAEQSEKNEISAREYLTRLQNKDESIKTEELEELVDRMKSLPLYSIEVFNKLKVFLLLYQLKDLVRGDTGKVAKRRLESWASLLKEREKVAAENTNKEVLEELSRAQLVEALNVKYKEGVILMKHVSNLKKNKLRDKFSIVDLELLIEFLTNSCIDFGEEVKLTENIMNNAKELESLFRELVEKKGNLLEFKILKKQIQKLPVNLNGIEDKLGSLIRAAGNTLDDVKDLARSDLKNNTKIIESEFLPVLAQYEKLSCRIEEIEILKTKYEKSKKSLRELKETLEETENIFRITNAVSELPFEMDISIKALSLQLCRKKYTLIGKGEHKLTLISLNALLEDYKNLKDELEPLDLEKIKHLEQLWQEAETIAKKIKEITTLDNLKEYNRTIYKEVIDYTDPILEQKARIELNCGVEFSITGKRYREENVEAILIEQGYNIIRSKEDLEKLAAKSQQEKEVREKVKKSFELLITGNSRLRKGKKLPSELSEELEEALAKEADPFSGLYRERANQIRSGLTKLMNHQLLSEYISTGKLQLYKLLKCRDDYKLSKKFDKIEEILIKNGKKVRRSEEDISAKKKLRASLLEDTKELPEHYDPLESFPQRHFAQKTRKTEPKREEDNESLEDVEILGDAFPIEQFPYSHRMPYQPGIIQYPIEPNTYDPLDFGPVQPFTRKSALIPQDTNERLDTQIDTAPPGTLLKIWTGDISSGSLFFHASMFTCDDIRDYQHIPAFNHNLEIDGRAKLLQVFDYINTSTHLLILKGWIATEKFTEALGSYLEELESTERCGVIDIKEVESHLYLIPWNIANMGFIQQWALGNPPSSLMVKFVYFFTYKRQDHLEMYKPMRPIIVTQEMPQADVLSEEGNPLIDQQLLKEMLKEKLSELTIDEINNIKAHLTEESKQDLEKILKETFPETTQPPLNELLQSELQPSSAFPDYVEELKDEEENKEDNGVKEKIIKDLIDQSKDIFTQLAFDPLDKDEAEEPENA